MNENDLQEMFRRREGDVRAPLSTPEPIRRRTRRRQIGTVCVATVTAIALVAVPLVGLRFLGRGADRAPTPGGSVPVVLPSAPDGFRAAALPYASIAYPDGWFLTDASPLEWYGVAQPKPILSGPVLQLSNFDPNLHSSPRCFFDAEPIPNDGVLLTVAVQAAEDSSIPAPTAPWPVDLGPYPSNTDPECAQGVDLIASWIAPSGAYYWANSTFGIDSTEADRSAMKAAFASMIFPRPGEPWMSTFAADQGQGSPRLVLDTAVFHGVPLTLVAFLDHYKALVIGVSGPTGNSLGGSAIDVGSGSGPPEPVETTMSATPEGAVVFGESALDVVRAEINTQEARTFPATILQLPATIGATRNAVWGFVEGATLDAQTIGYDASGNVLGNPIITTAPPEIVASGDDSEAGPWTVSITHDTMGDGLAFSWGSGGGGGGCCLSDKHFAGQVLQLDGMNSGGSAPSVITAFASTQVSRVVAKFPGGSFDGQLSPLPEKYLGPAQVVVVIISSGVSLNGTLIAYDATGREVGRVPIDGGPPQEPSGSTPAIDEVVQDLYAARDAASKYYAEQGTFDGLNLSTLGGLAPSVTFDRSASAVAHEVSVRVSSPNELAVVSTTENGSVFCIGVQVDAGGGNNLYYGRVDAAGFGDCRGGWGPPPIS